MNELIKTILFRESRVWNAVRLCGAVGCTAFLSLVLLSSDPWALLGFRPEVQDDLFDGGSDKLYHIVGYFGLTLSLFWCGLRRSLRVLIALVVAATVHAVGTELGQQFIPRRQTDLLDLFANLIGIGLGCSIGMILRRMAVRTGSRAGENSERTVESGESPVDGSDSVQSVAPVGLERNQLTPEQVAEVQPRMLNLRFLGILTACGAVFFGSVFGLHAWQVRDNAGALLELGRQAHDSGDRERAREYYSRYVGLVPNDVNALADYGMLLDESAVNEESARHVFTVYENVLRNDQTREDIRRRQIDNAIRLKRYSDALAHVNILRQTHPMDGGLDYQAGLCLEKLSDFERAAEAWEAAIEHDPSQVAAWAGLASLYQMELDQPDRAEVLIQDLVERNGDRAAAWLARAKYHQETDRLDQASDDLQQALQMNPDDADTLLLAAELGYERAIEATGRGRRPLADRIVAESQALLSHAIELHPQRLDLRLQLVMLTSHFGREKRAIELISELLDDAPGDPRAHLLLADLTIQRGDFDKARKAIEALPRTPGSDALRLFLQARVEMSEEQWEAAIVTLEDGRRYMADAPSMLERTDLALARCHRAMDDVEGEKNDFRRLLKYHPQSIPGRLGLASTLLRDRRLEEALAEYRQLSHLSQVRLLLCRLLIIQNLQLPEVARDWQEVESLLAAAEAEKDDPAQIVLLRAELLAARDEMDEARELLESARTTQADRLEFLIALARLAEQAGDKRQASLWMGQALAAIGDPEKAEEHLTEAVESNPEDGAAAQTLMRFLLRQNRRDDAIKVFTKHAREMSRRELAVTYALFGDLARAVDLLKQELDSNPNDVDALEGLTELYLKHGHPDRAEPLLERIVAQGERVPRSTLRAARRRLAVILASHQDHSLFRRALKLLDENSAKDAQPGIEDRRARAAVLATSAVTTDRSEAIELLEQLGDQYQLRTRDHWLLGKLYDSAGQFDQATEQLERVLLTRADDDALLSEYIEHLIRVEQLDKAAEWLKRLQATAPGIAATVRLEAALLAAQDDIQGALAKINQLASGDAGDVEAAIAAASSLTRAGGPNQLVFEQATERLLRHAVQNDPTQVARLMVWQIEQGRHAEAREHLETAWKHLPAEAAAGLSLAALGAVSDDTTIAAVERRLTAAITKDRRSSLLVVCLADLRALQGRYDDAEDLYREVLVTDPQNLPALNNFAWLLAMRERHLDEAMLLIERAITAAGPAPQLLDTRGCVYLAFGNIGPALIDLEQSAAATDDPTTLLHLALAQARAGEVPLARATLARAVTAGLQVDGLNSLDVQQHDELQRLLSPETE